MRKSLIFAILTFILLSSNILAQSVQLKLNQEAKFSLKNKEEKTFDIELKKGDYTEIGWEDSLQRFPNFSVISPSGKNITAGNYELNPFPFVAKEDGKYKLIVRFEETDENKEGSVSVYYSNVFKLPRSAKLKTQKKVNGYDVRIYNTSQNEKNGYGTYLLIQKAGKLVDILRGGSLIAGGFTFNENPADYDDAERKKSANLFRNTLDKTGDGTPDIAIGFYTGGAHCCFNMHIFELGKDDVRKLETIEGEDSDVIAIGKTPKGGLILRTGDSNFAYWLTSFAGSPIPTVVLTYQNGEFRPDAKLMKKPAPTLAVLKKKAAAAKKELDLTPYEGEENSGFINAFWDEMLDLMYSGNETSAWQYFDLVWDSRKQGKEKFKQDFLKRLNESEFWRRLQEGKK
jgi:hypothetical protein